MKDAGCVHFLQWALLQLGYRWPGFRRVRGQVCKRIRRRMRILGIMDVVGYRQRLERDPAEWTLLDGFCRITISRFNRDKDVFRTIGDIILPERAARAASDNRDLRAWSAGCASGEEVYSLKFSWSRVISRTESTVGLELIGTDVDEAVLSRAADGCYDAGSLRELPAETIEACFERRNGTFCVKPAFRGGISFRRQDIRAEMPQGPFDLVLCRNLVLTYFDVPLQTRLLQEVAGRLIPGGYLVVGTHEELPMATTGFEPTSDNPQIYRRCRSQADGRPR